MQFNSNAQQNDLVNDTLFLTRATTAAYPLVDITRNVNQAYHDVSRLIWQSSSGWQYDDSSKSDLPIATFTLVDGQQDYEIPSTAQQIERVEVKDDDGDYQRITQIDWHDVSISMTEYMETDGMPKHYDLVGRSVFFYPAPDSDYVTLASGGKFYVSRDVGEFTTASTTATPGFATQFHRILSLSAAIDFEEDDAKRDRFIMMKTRLERGLTKFYGGRNIEREASVRPYGRRRWKQYL